MPGMRSRIKGRLSTTRIRTQSEKPPNDDSENNRDIVTTMSEKTNVHQIDANKKNLLMHAVESSNKTVALDLIKKEGLVNTFHGANEETVLMKPKLKDLHGSNVLHHAALSANTSIIQLLIERVSLDQINVKNKDNQTPCIIAFKAGRIKTVLFLMSKGVDCFAEVMEARLSTDEQIDYTTDVIAQCIFKKIEKNYTSLLSFINNNASIKDMKSLSMNPHSKTCLADFYDSLKHSLDDLPSVYRYCEKNKEQEMIIKKLLAKLQLDPQVTQHNMLVAFFNYIIESLRDLFLRLSLSKSNYSKVVLLNVAKKSISNAVRSPLKKEAEKNLSSAF
jgi:ankyrin repeat protein